eukprot:scaffold548651_cov37-Prasinocladus_malaysianus.AAC.1
MKRLDELKKEKQILANEVRSLVAPSMPRQSPGLRARRVLLASVIGRAGGGVPDQYAPEAP